MNNLDNIPYKPIIGEANIVGKYTLKEGDSIGKVWDTSNKLQTDILKVDIMEIADKRDVHIGDIINFKIFIINNSSMELTGVRIKNRLPLCLKLIESSVQPVPHLGESLETGVEIGSLAVGEGAFLFFSAIVGEDAALNMTSTACCDFNYVSGNIVMRGNEEAESINIAVACPEIQILKTADRSIITKKDNIITYTLAVANIGNITLTDIAVTDEIPYPLEYVAKSTVVGSNPPINISPKSGIIIPRLKSGESIIIRFSAEVMLP